MSKSNASSSTPSNPRKSLWASDEEARAEAKLLEKEHLQADREDAAFFMEMTAESDRDSEPPN